MNKVNFLPEDYVEKKAQQRTNIICLGLFFIVMTGVAGGFMVTEKRQRDIDKQVERVNQDMAQASESLKQLEELEKKKNQMMQKASVSASLMETVPRSLLLAILTNDLPAGVSLLDIKLDCKKQESATAKTKEKPKNKKKTNDPKEEKKEELPEPLQFKTTLEMMGLAGSDIQVAQLISNLNRCNFFTQVNLIFSEECVEKEESLRKFKLQIHLDPAAKASEADVQMARSAQVYGM